MRPSSFTGGHDFSRADRYSSSPGGPSGISPKIEIQVEKKHLTIYSLRIFPASHKKQLARVTFRISPSIS